MIKTKRIKYVLGSIIAIPLQYSQYTFAIPLESMKYAYAKTHMDGDLGVYNLISDEILSLEEVVKHSISFYQYGTDKAIKNGLWPILGVLPFASEKESLLPPMATCYDRDSNTWTMSKPRIYYNGESYFVDEKEVCGLDIFGVSISPEATVHVITDRLIKGNHDYYKVRE
jgi:hypothetical protein